ncbi:hypothetical protein VTN02DRAFT_5493 [Thermoascus thermophilus]
MASCLTTIKQVLALLLVGIVHHIHTTFGDSHRLGSHITTPFRDVPSPATNTSPPCSQPRAFSVQSPELYSSSIPILISATEKIYRPAVSVTLHGKKGAENVTQNYFKAASPLIYLEIIYSVIISHIDGEYEDPERECLILLGEQIRWGYCR